MQADSWQERCLAVVPEKLTACDVRVLLGLLLEDPLRLQAALEAFVASRAEGKEEAPEA